MQISFVMLIFLLFSDQFQGEQKSLRGANCLRGVSPTCPPPVEESQFNLWGDLKDHILLKVNFRLQVISAFRAMHYSNVFLMRFLETEYNVLCVISL